MALTTQQRAELSARIMSEKSAIREVLPLSKNDLRAAINAVDDLKCAFRKVAVEAVGGK